MRTLLLASSLLIAPPAFAQSIDAAAPVLTPERVFADPSLNGPVARGVSLSPDGELVAFLRSREDDVNTLDLWAAPTGEGEPYKLIDARALVPDAGELSEAEIARRERMRISQRGVVEYSWDEQGRYILAPLEGDIFLADRNGEVRRLTETEGDEIDAKVSPQGTWASWVRDQNLYIQPLAGGDERAVTTDGDGLITWATAEFIAQEEMDRDTGYWWSPDERRIALTRVDESTVDVIPRLDIQGGGATTVEQRYPRAGRPNAVVDLFIHDVASGQRIEVDLGENDDIYLARVNWSADGGVLYVQRQSRDQQTLDLLSVDPATGESRVIVTQTDDAWVELTHDFHPLSDGRFIWSTEETGWRHLHLYEADGTMVRSITHGDWPVKALEGVNEETGEVFFTASLSVPTPVEDLPFPMPRGHTTCRLPGNQVTMCDHMSEAPTTQRLWRARLDRMVSQLEPVTSDGGWWTVSMNGPGTAFVGTYSDPETPSQTGLYSSDGTLIRWIEENRLDEDHPYYPYLARHRTPEYGVLDTANHARLVWQMTTPHDFDPSRRYPAVIQVYGGPSGGGVRRSWQPLTTRLLNEAGYVVFRVDNRGEGYRSAAFKRALYRRMGTVEIEDQVVGAEYLRSLPYIDTDRIAAMGWSYGGFMTLHMLTEPEMGLASAISGAPVTDWSLYDTHYTERFMSTPEDNPDGYAASDVVDQLDQMTGRLLLLHGMADDNVIFENTTRLLNALQEQSVPFETMLYPGQRHGIRGNPRQLHQWRTYLDFLDRTIGERSE